MHTPLRTRAFEAFIAPAQRYPQLWRLILGTVLIGGIYYAVLLTILLPAEITGIIGSDYILDTRGSMTALFLTFTGAILGVWAAIKLLHKRSFGTLLGPWGAFRKNFITAAGTILILQSLWMLLGALIDGSTPNQSLSSVILFLPVAFILVLLQTGAEEIVFRSYLMQQLGARFKSPAIWFLLPPLGFGLLHYNPAMYGGIAWGVVIGITLTGLAWADLTRVTGNIGAAWGWHFMNNFLLFNFLSLQHDMNGFAWRTSDLDVKNMGAFEIYGDIGFTLASWLILRRILRA